MPPPDPVTTPWSRLYVAVVKTVRRLSYPALADLLKLSQYKAKHLLHGDVEVDLTVPEQNRLVEAAAVTTRLPQRRLGEYAAASAKERRRDFDDVVEALHRVFEAKNPLYGLLLDAVDDAGNQLPVKEAARLLGISRQRFDLLVKGPIENMVTEEAIEKACRKARKVWRLRSG